MTKMTQPPGVRPPGMPPGMPPNGMEAYHPHAMAAMNLGLNMMAMGGPGTPIIKCTRWSTPYPT